MIFQLKMLRPWIKRYNAWRKETLTYQGRPACRPDAAGLKKAL
jgi:hypothetical protein